MRMLETDVSKSSGAFIFLLFPPAVLSTPGEASFFQSVQLVFRNSNVWPKRIILLWRKYSSVGEI